MKQEDHRVTALVVGIIALTTGLPLLGGCGLVLLVLATSHEADTLTPRQRAMLLTSEDLGEHFEGVSQDPSLETVTASHDLLTDELDYNYEIPDGLYITSSLTDETSDSEARDTMNMLKLGIDIGTRGEEAVKIVERPLTLAWPEVWAADVVGTEEDNLIGHMVLARRRDRVFMTMFVGAAFDDPEALRGLLDPILERAAAADLDEPR